MSKFLERVKSEIFLVKMTRADAYTLDQLDTTATFSHTGNKQLDSGLARELIAVGRTIEQIMVHYEEGSEIIFTDSKRQVTDIKFILEGLLDDIESYFSRGNGDIAATKRSTQEMEHIKQTYEDCKAFLNDVCELHSNIVPAAKKREELIFNRANSKTVRFEPEETKVKLMSAGGAEQSGGVKPWLRKTP